MPRKSLTSTDSEAMKGKDRNLASSALQVLAAAASNIAVDNLVERFTAADPKLLVVRLGHPARLLPQVWDLKGRLAVTFTPQVSLYAPHDDAKPLDQHTRAQLLCLPTESLRCIKAMPLWLHQCC